MWTAVRMMRPSCYMASIDLKDAYYSVPMHKNYQKYLKFYSGGNYTHTHCYEPVLSITNGYAFGSIRSQQRL